MLLIFPARRVRLYMASAALAVVLISGSQPALAGFEWVTGAPGASQDADLPPLQGAQDNTQEGTQPGPANSDHVLRLPQDYETQTQMPVTPDAAHIRREPLPAAKPSIMDDKVEISATLPGENPAPGIVQGFGDDIPLALALQQLVPAGYTYSFGVSVNPGLRVSWNDGKPWQETIDTMLAPHGLRLDVQGKNIRIDHRAADTSAEIKPAARSNEIIFDDTQARVIHRLHIADPGQEPGLQPSPQKRPEPLSPMPDRLSSYEQGAQAPSIKGEEIIYLLPPEVEPDAKDSKKGSQPVDVWEASKGQSVRETLESWTRNAGVSLRWEASHDYRLDNSIMISDQFTAALKTMIEDGLEPQNRPVMRYVAGGEGAGPATLIVQDSQGRL